MVSQPCRDAILFDPAVQKMSIEIGRFAKLTCIHQDQRMRDALLNIAMARAFFLQNLARLYFLW